MIDKEKDDKLREESEDYVHISRLVEKLFLERLTNISILNEISLKDIKMIASNLSVLAFNTIYEHKHHSKKYKIHDKDANSSTFWEDLIIKSVYGIDKK